MKTDLSPHTNTDNIILEVHNLTTHFFTEEGTVRAVDGVDLTVERGEIFGLVGESGCGKTVAALSILGLIEEPGKILGGRVIFEGKDLLKLSAFELNSIRGSRLSMIFQEPLNSLNPVFTVGAQIAEVLQVHEQVGAKLAWSRAVDLLDSLLISDGSSIARRYPHELSGGQAQRVMIALALVLKPSLLIADEPTTALDVTIQAQILDLLKKLRSEMGTSIIFITHDLGVIAEVVDRVAVMYAGCIVEQTDRVSLFDNPLHPYTQGLVACVPTPGSDRIYLNVISGIAPDPRDLPRGCRFTPRCTSRVAYKLSICENQEPDLIRVQPEHFTRCWLYQSLGSHRAPIPIEEIKA
jgi:oligopeptide/dipeptide ABC transporter ATP-binding protein